MDPDALARLAVPVDLGRGYITHRWNEKSRSSSNARERESLRERVEER
jgi:hypothetical protein